MDKVGRNDPCPCGSGKKFKKCCEAKTPKKKKINAQVLTSNEAALLSRAQGLASLFKRIAPTEAPRDLKERVDHPSDEPKNLLM